MSGDRRGERRRGIWGSDSGAMGVLFSVSVSLGHNPSSILVFLVAVLLNDMDEAEVAPSEMFSRLGMLVVESRVPHLSAKGRSEGPHCPPSPWDLPPHHTCRPHSSPLVSLGLRGGY